jgi:hypothetical protein
MRLNDGYNGRIFRYDAVAGRQPDEKTSTILSIPLTTPRGSSAPPTITYSIALAVTA